MTVHRISLYIITASLIFGLSCNQQGTSGIGATTPEADSHGNDHEPIEWFGRQFLGKDLVAVSDVIGSYTTRDTIVESDDGVSWPAKALRLENELLLLLETGWQNVDTIQVINIVSPRVASAHGIRIGSRFKDVRQYLSRDIPSQPDGYFAIRDSSDKSVLYFFDVSSDSSLYFGDREFDSIPDDLTIEAIQIETP